ncbi:MAG: heme ABC transporter ATP-binding protein [Gemmobacter sp.]
MLDVEDLSVSLAGHRLLSGVTFAALPGSVTAIIGPNGSGKTTLLRALTGEVGFRGTVRLNGHDVAATRAPVLAGFRAVLAQSTAVAFPFAVREIVRFGQEAGIGPADAGLADRLLAEVDLAGYGPRRFHDLSGGEQARVHLARVLAQARLPITPQGPGWLFLDEPVASLDIAHQLLVMRIARRLADAGGGVVMVMHDLNLTAMVTDRVLLLRGGALIGQGRVEDVLTDRLLSAAFGTGIRVNTAPVQGRWVLPQAVGVLSAPAA